MKIFNGTASRDLAEKIAKILKIELSRLELNIFPDEEKRVRVVDKVVGQDCIVVQSTSTNADKNYMELFFIVDALKRSGARSVTAVIPYLGYQRQDHVFREGEAVSLEVIIKTLKAVGTDKIVTFDLHSIKIPELFHIPVVHLSALRLFAEKISGVLRSLRQFKNFSNASVPAARYHSPRDTVAYGDSSEKIFHAKAPRSLELIIVGKKGWLYEEILEAPKKFKIEDKVKFLDFVPDEDLPLLYKNALCFVLPSLYEGFGLPVLEAMKYGCPVITSNVSSLPEAGGDAALYVDPKSIDDIASKIKLLIADKKLRQELIRKGYEQVKKFSWEKTARETLRVLGSIK